MNLKSLSKFLSYVLRHHPEAIGLELDQNGWAEVAELIDRAQNEGKSLDRKTIRKIIQQGAKQRFILSDDGQYIRAGYGHSINVDLQLHPKAPPVLLHHGTARQNVESILSEGLKPGNRNFVHLSAEKTDARQVGARHGAPVILKVQAKTMHNTGHYFHQSESEPGIWLTKKVPAEFLEVR